MYLFLRGFGVLASNKHDLTIVSIINVHLERGSASIQHLQFVIWRRRCTQHLGALARAYLRHVEPWRDAPTNLNIVGIEPVVALKQQPHAALAPRCVEARASRVAVELMPELGRGGFRHDRSSAIFRTPSHQHPATPLPTTEQSDAALACGLPRCSIWTGRTVVPRCPRLWSGAQDGAPAGVEGGATCSG
jgi:hypothetical protein